MAAHCAPRAKPTVKEVAPPHVDPAHEPTTMSGIPIKRCYGPDDIGHIEFLRDLGSA